MCNRRKQAKVTKDGNRFLLARIPIVEKNGTYTLEKEVVQNGEKLTAAKLRGDDKGNDLTEALAQDEHLQSFLTIPGKDNGFDIEGLAIAGDRIDPNQNYTFNRYFELGFEARELAEFSTLMS
ncbi:DUF3616 domain-containing protein [Scytonema sp. UIC 10036]|uniref:DUF3616 domain-containing protein n=1 Tax=Scytonema sp. UIC 10036 TaxID=2304196 RepID=UPI00325AB9E0